MLFVFFVADLFSSRRPDGQGITPAESRPRNDCNRNLPAVHPVVLKKVIDGRPGGANAL
jgi:hypothetical protein